MRTFINKIKGNFPAFLNVISALAKKKKCRLSLGRQRINRGPRMSDVKLVDNK